MPTLNDEITTAGNTIETLAYNSLTTYLETQYPWLNFVVIKQIFELLSKYLLNILFTKTEYAIYVAGITEIIKQQDQAFKDAVNSNDQTKIIAAAKSFISLNSP